MPQAELREDKTTIFKGGFEIDREIISGTKTTISFYDGKFFKDAEHGFKLSYPSDHFNNAIAAIFSDPKNKKMFINAGLDEKYVDALFKFFNTERKTSWGFVKSQYGSTTIEYTASGLSPKEARELAEKEAKMEVVNAFCRTPEFERLSLKMYDAGTNATKLYNAEIEFYKAYDEFIKKNPQYEYGRSPSKLYVPIIKQVISEAKVQGPIFALKRAKDELVSAYREALDREDFQELLRKHNVDPLKKDEKSIRKGLVLLIKEELPSVFDKFEYWDAVTFAVADLAEKKAPQTQIAKKTESIKKKVPVRANEDVKQFQIAYNYLVEEGLIKGERLVLDGIRGPKTKAAEEKVREFLRKRGINVKGSYAELDKAVRKWNDEQGNKPIETAVAKEEKKEAKTEEKPPEGVFIPKLAQIYTGGQLRNVPLEDEIKKERERREELNEKRVSEMIGAIRKAIEDGNKKMADAKIEAFKDFAGELKTIDPANYRAAEKLLATLREPYYAKFGKPPEEKKVADEERYGNFAKAVMFHSNKALDFITRGQKAFADEEIAELKKFQQEAKTEREKKLANEQLKKVEDAYSLKFKNEEGTAEKKGDKKEETPAKKEEETFTVPEEKIPPSLRRPKGKQGSN